MKKKYGIESILGKKTRIRIPELFIKYDTLKVLLPANNALSQPPFSTNITMKKGDPLEICDVFNEATYESDVDLPIKEELASAFLSMGKTIGAGLVFKISFFLRYLLKMKSPLIRNVSYLGALSLMFSRSLKFSESIFSRKRFSRFKILKGSTKIKAFKDIIQKRPREDDKILPSFSYKASRPFIKKGSLFSTVASSTPLSMTLLPKESRRFTSKKVIEDIGKHVPEIAKKTGEALQKGAASNVSNVSNVQTSSSTTQQSSTPQTPAAKITTHHNKKPSFVESAENANKKDVPPHFQNTKMPASIRDKVGARGKANTSSKDTDTSKDSDKNPKSEPNESTKSSDYTSTKPIAKPWIASEVTGPQTSATVNTTTPKEIDTKNPIKVTFDEVTGEIIDEYEYKNSDDQDHARVPSSTSDSLSLESHNSTTVSDSPHLSSLNVSQVNPKIANGNTTSSTGDSMVSTSFSPLQTTTTTLNPLENMEDSASVEEVNTSFYIPPAPPLPTTPPSDNKNTILYPEIRLVTSPHEVSGTLTDKITAITLEKENRKEIIQQQFTTLEKNITSKREEFIKQYKTDLTNREDAIKKKFKKMQEDGNWSILEVKLLLKEMQELEAQSASFILTNDLMLNRDKLECLRLYPENIPIIKECDFAAKKFLSSVTIKTCYTLEEYQQEKLRMREGYDLLHNFGNQLSEPVFFEVIRRLGIVINNDAQEEGFYPEGQGFTLRREVYKHIAENSFSFINDNQMILTQEQYNQIFSNIQNGDYKIYHTKFNIDNNIDPNSSKALESSEEIHLNVVTYFTNTDGKKFLVSLGQFTSSRDPGTVVICPKQYLNVDDHEKKKVQYLRVYRQLVQLPEEKFIEFPEGTKFALDENINHTKINVKENIINAILMKKEVIQNNPVRLTHNFTRTNLQEIAKSFSLYKAQILDMEQNKLSQKIEALPEHKRSNLIEDRKNKYNENKMLENRAYVLRQLSPEYKNIKAKLEQYKIDNETLCTQIKNNNNYDPTQNKSNNT